MGLAGLLTAAGDRVDLLLQTPWPYTFRTVLAR